MQVNTVTLNHQTAPQYRDAGPPNPAQGSLTYFTHLHVALVRELLLRAPLRPRRVVAAALHELARGACVRGPYRSEAVLYSGRPDAVPRPYFGRT